jgi:5'(3')-deoxyribonucleotidase
VALYVKKSLYCFAKMNSIKTLTNTFKSIDYVQMKPALFFDFDEVLFSTREISLRFFREHYGATIPNDMYFCGHSLETLIMEQIPQEQRPTKDEFYQYFSHELLASFERHKNLEPIVGAQEVINELAKKYNLYVATARHECSKAVVRHLVDSFFPGKLIDIHHVWRYDKLIGFHGIPKRDFVSRHETRIGFIDDNPKEIRDMSGITEAFLFDPFGYHIDETDISNRVTSWEEIGNIFL